MTNKDLVVSIGSPMAHVAPGTHLCYIYNDDNERRQVISSFLEDGFTHGALVCYAGDKENPDEVFSCLKEMGLDFSKMSRDDQLIPLCAESTYCPDKNFSPDRMIDSVRSFCQHGSSKGFSGLWMSGEMNWALKGYPGSERVAEYESRVNLLANELPIGGICQYDSRRFDGATLFDILQVHPFMIARGQVVHNPYYIPPESYICKPSASQ